MYICTLENHDQKALQWIDPYVLTA